MNATLCLVLGLAAQAGAQPAPPASQPASQPAAGVAAGVAGTARDVLADVTIIFEVGERALNVQEGWNLTSPAGRTIPAPELSVPMPPGAKFLAVDPNIKGHKAEETSTAMTATQPLTGAREANASYVFDLDGDEAHLARVVPFSIQRARLVIQSSPGLTLSTNVPAERRSRELSGVEYNIYDIGAIAAGSELRIDLDGLPSRTIWPRRAAAVIAVLMVGWMFWAISTRSAPGLGGTTALSPLSARARRDQLVKALEVLERDLHEEKVKPKRYERRRSELMQELARVLREVELGTGPREAG